MKVGERILTTISTWVNFWTFVNIRGFTSVGVTVVLIDALTYTYFMVYNSEIRI